MLYPSPWPNTHSFKAPLIPWQKNLDNLTRTVAPRMTSIYRVTALSAKWLCRGLFRVHSTGAGGGERQTRMDGSSGRRRIRNANAGFPNPGIMSLWRKSPGFYHIIVEDALGIAWLDSTQGLPLPSACCFVHSRRMQRRNGRPRSTIWRWVKKA